MIKRDFLKKLAIPAIKFLQIDRLFRYLNRRKVLILAYHGVTKNKYNIPPWTLIPVDIFEQQIEYISKRYNIITLQEAVEGMINDDLPLNAAVITFDDGYKNNLTIALPILKKYRTPATIFLTAGYIGSNDILPLDEVYLIVICSENRNAVTIPEIGIGPLFFDTNDAMLKSHNEIIQTLKRFSTREIKNYLEVLKRLLGSNDYKSNPDIIEDFILLSWEDIETLIKTDLIQFGAHTASHEILTNLSLKDACEEIKQSRIIIQNKLGKEINTFAYPNGKEFDYNSEHIQYIRDNGFICSLTTIPKLNDMHENLFQLGRICIGPDFSSNSSHFALTVSGLIASWKSIGITKNGKP